MAHHTNADKKVENFDEICIGTPIEIEKKINKLLPSAKSLKNKSIYLQMLSRLAVAQALQKKFKLAHKTLDKAENELTPEQALVQVRLLLERGRVFIIAYDFKAALPHVKKCYQLSKKYKLEMYAIDAAHMMPVIVNNVKDKIKWNKIAINIAEKSRNKKEAKEWIKILHQAIGLNYIEAKQYKKALLSFKKSKQLVEKSGPKILAIGAKIGIAKSLRLLNQIDDALDIQIKLIKDCNILKNKNLHPIEINLFYGWIYEELAELHLKKVMEFSPLAYQHLSKDPWHIKNVPARLARMQKLSKLF